MGKYDELVERLEHCSNNTRDEYLHELTGRAATAITTLEAELAAMKASGDRLANALSKGGFMMTETHRLEGHPGARKLIIGFEDGEHADDAMAAIRQALTEWRQINAD